MTDTPSPLAQAEEVLTPSAQSDYFGVDEVHRFMLPDGISYVEHKTMTEGARRKYQAATNKDVKLSKAGDATIKMAPGEERVALLDAALCGWNLKKGGKDMSFSPSARREFMDAASPTIIDLIIDDIREHNAWLMADLTVEDIDKEIENLKQQRDELLEKEAGKGTS